MRSPPPLRPNARPELSPAVWALLSLGALLDVQSWPPADTLRCLSALRESCGVDDRTMRCSATPGACQPLTLIPTLHCANWPPGQVCFRVMVQDGLGQLPPTSSWPGTMSSAQAKTLDKSTREGCGGAPPALSGCLQLIPPPASLGGARPGLSQAAQLPAPAPGTQQVLTLRGDSCRPLVALSPFLQGKRCPRLRVLQGQCATRTAAVLDCIAVACACCRRTPRSAAVAQFAVPLPPEGTPKAHHDPDPPPPPHAGWVHVR